MEDVELVGVVTRLKSDINADFCSLQPQAQQHGIPCFLACGNDQSAMAQWLRELHPDYIYCFGWSYLLRKEILDLPKCGVIGFHPAALPHNRGRHPIIWALVLGLNSTASTFFFMDEGADSGDILSQQIVPVFDKDDASSLYDRITTVALDQIAEFTADLSNGNNQRTPQQHNLATYWRKRTKADGCIDWRMSAKSIYNLVRALSFPYSGASCVYRGQENKIWKVDIESLREHFSNIEYGKVIEIKPPTFVVKCGEGAIRILKHDFIVLPSLGEYL